MVEIRHPLYFDSGDARGYQLSKTTFTYNGRGLQATQAVKLNSTQTTTTTTTYYLDGKPEKRTDPQSYDWYSY